MKSFDESRQVACENSIIIGRFGRVFGVKGWIYVISFTDPPENILSYASWWGVGDGKNHQDWKPVVITDHHQDRKGIRVKLEGCDSPDTAQLLVNLAIAIPQEKLPSLDPGQYYWLDLVGAKVKNKSGLVLGVVDYLFETASNDVMVVKGEKEHWIPYLESVVLEVNLKEKEIQVDWDADF